MSAQVHQSFARSLAKSAVRATLGRIPSNILDKASGHTLLARIDHLKSKGFDPRVILDIGAYEGHWTEIIAGRFPASQIVMVEGQDQKKDVLERCVRRLGPNVTCEIALLGREARSDVEFFEMETGSSIYPELTSIARKRTLRPMTTLAALMQSRGLAGADFIKLDVQGAEIDILAGGLEIFRRASLVQAELAVTPYNAGAPLAHDVIRFMADNGFHLFDMFDFKRVSATAQISQFDALFINTTSDLHARLSFDNVYQSGEAGPP